MSVRRSSSSNSGSNLATHAGAAEAAITVRVLRQILLVIVLGEIKRRRLADFGGDRAQALGGECLGITRTRSLSLRKLRRRKRINAGAVLRADVVALSHALRRIVTFPESLEQPLVGDFLRIVDDEDDLVVAGMPAADF